MDIKELEKKWHELGINDFNDFINKYVGHKDGEDRPECFGCGGGLAYCEHCN